MNSTIVHSFSAALCAAAVGLAQAPQPSAERNQEANIKAYLELLRKDIRREKVGILTEMLELSPEEAAKFWPVYNEYDKELTVLAQPRGKGPSGAVSAAGAKGKQLDVPSESRLIFTLTAPLPMN